jgi:hypothetical protein
VRRTVAIAIVAGALAIGCGPTHYSWTGGDGTKFKLIDWQCQRDSQAISSVPVFGSEYNPNLRVSLPTVVGAAPVQELDEGLYVKCMAAHGYTLRLKH